jgi:hypothetical protein
MIPQRLGPWPFLPPCTYRPHHSYQRAPELSRPPAEFKFLFLGAHGGLRAPSFPSWAPPHAPPAAYLVGVVALGALSLEDLCTLLDVARGDGDVRLRDPHCCFLAFRRTLTG